MYPDPCDFIKKSDVSIKDCPDLVWLQKYKICGECPPCCRRAAEREREEICREKDGAEEKEEKNMDGEGEKKREEEGDGDDEVEEHLKVAIEKESRKGERSCL